MTEDEAKQKLCPFISRPDLGEKRTNYGNREHCIASDCMMWIATDNECKPQEPEGTALYKSECYPAGYCGLAGKP